MITLSTLPQATAQQVFDQVVEHLRKQGRKSVSINGQCCYRSPGNLSCAAGCLIADDEYDVRLEYAWDNLVRNRLVPNHHGRLILQLQMVHDSDSVDEWENKFKSTAQQFNLTYTPIR